MGDPNCASLSGIPKIPSDNHIRDMLDPASPTLLYPAFAEAVTQLGRIAGGLDVFRRLDRHVLIALDGTEYHCSRNIHCAQCSTRLRGKGDTEYYHAMLAATLVAPGHDKVIPLEPEFIVPQDGAEKQDCENMAAKRWLAAHGRRYAALDAIYLGDDLFSRQPLCQAVRDVDGHFIFVCKPSSHPLIQEYLTGAVRHWLRPRHPICLRAWRRRRGPHGSPCPKSGARDWGWCVLGPQARSGSRRERRAGTLLACT